MKRMKEVFAKRLSMFAMLMLAFVAVGTAVACSGMDVTILSESIMSGGVAGMSVAGLPIFFKMVGEVKTFVELNDEQYGKLEDAEKAEYLAAQIKDNRKGFNDLKAQLKDSKDKDAEAIKTLEEDFKAKSQSMLNTLEKQAEVMAEIQKNGLTSKGTEVDYSLTINVIEKAKKTIENFKNGEVSSVILNLKSTVVSTDVQNSTASQRILEIGKIPVRKTPMRDLFRSAPITEGRNNGTITYIDQDTLVRNANNVASCDPVPESDINWIERSCKVEKIGDSIKVCKDALEDFDFIANEVDQFLRENINLKYDQQLLFGTGTTPQLKGVDSTAQTWSVGGGSPIIGLALAIQSPTIGDVMSTAIKQVENSGQNNSYVVNHLLMNPTDVELMVLTKDLNNNSVESKVIRIGDDGTVFVKGVPVIENPLVVQNTAYAGDFNKGTVYPMREMKIEMTDSNASEFVSDIATIKGTMRSALVIRNVWANAFIKVTDIDAAIVALTKP